MLSDKSSTFFRELQTGNLGPACLSYFQHLRPSFSFSVTHRSDFAVLLAIRTCIYFPHRLRALRLFVMTSARLGTSRRGRSGNNPRRGTPHIEVGYQIKYFGAVLDERR